MNDDLDTLAALRSQLEQKYYHFNTYSTLYDPTLFDEVQRINERSPQEAVIIIDAFHSVKKLLSWQKLLPTVQPHFAVKCNPDPVLVTSLALSKYAGFDCASVGEIQLVLDAGAPASSIIFANPSKPPEAIHFALQRGITRMTFDSSSELEKIRAILSSAAAEDYPMPQLVLRLRVPDDHSSSPLGTKFGAEMCQVSSLLQCATRLSLPIIGLSFHCGSGCYDVTAYVTALHMAAEAIAVAKSLNMSLHVVDMGGGFPGLVSRREIPQTDPEPPLTLEQIAAVVNPLLKQLFTEDITVIAEPGRYCITSVCYLQIYDCQEISDDVELSLTSEGDEKVLLWLVNEGVLGCFKDIVLNDEKFEPHLVTPAAATTTETSNTRHVLVGCDGGAMTVLHAQLPFTPTIGAWIKYHRFGAYTVSIASTNFSNAAANKHYVWCKDSEL